MEFLCKYFDAARTFRSGMERTNTVEIRGGKYCVTNDSNREQMQRKLSRVKVVKLKIGKFHEGDEDVGEF